MFQVSERYSQKLSNQEMKKKEKTSTFMTFVHVARRVILTLCLQRSDPHIFGGG